MKTLKTALTAFVFGLGLTALSATAQSDNRQREEQSGAAQTQRDAAGQSAGQNANSGNEQSNQSQMDSTVNDQQSQRDQDGNASSTQQTDQQARPQANAGNNQQTDQQQGGSAPGDQQQTDGGQQSMPGGQNQMDNGQSTGDSQAERDLQEQLKQCDSLTGDVKVKCEEELKAQQGATKSLSQGEMGQYFINYDEMQKQKEAAHQAQLHSCGALAGDAQNRCVEDVNERFKSDES